MQKLIKFSGLLLGMLCLLSLFSCRTLSHSKTGYFTGEVDKYFNEKEGINVWLYRAFQPREDGKTGLRKENYYPLDERMMELVGIKKNANQVLFSVVPEYPPFYNMVAVKHLKNNVNLKGYNIREYKGANYYEKKVTSERMDIRHVYIPKGKKEGLSLLYYALEVENAGNPLAKFDYLAGINALEIKQKERYYPSWQIYDCEEPDRRDWILKPDIEKLKNHEVVYLKLYDVYGANKTISFFKLMKKDDRGPISLKLCPNEYILEYYSEKDLLIGQEKFRVN